MSKVELLDTINSDSLEFGDVDEVSTVTSCLESGDVLFLALVEDEVVVTVSLGNVVDSGST